MVNLAVFSTFWNLLNDKKVPEGLAMADYFNNVKTSIENPEEIFAIDCFEGVKSEDSRRIFYEHCIVYENCALSIIWED